VSTKKAKSRSAAQRAKEPQRVRGSLLSNKEAIVLMPTVPGRERLAITVIRSFIRQRAGKIVVFLNGHNRLQSKAFPKSDKLLYIVNKPGTGPICRFRAIHPRIYENYKYLFTVDDDINYPIDYLDKTIKALELHGDNYVISYHTSIWGENDPNYRSRKTTRIDSLSDSGLVMPFGGSGASAFSKSVFSKIAHSKIPKSSFEYNDDIWLSSFVQKTGLLFYRPPTSKNWLTIQKPHPKTNLFDSEKAQNFKRRNRKLKLAMTQHGLDLTKNKRDFAKSSRAVALATSKKSSGQGDEYDVFIYIKTYNRRSHIKALIKDIVSNTGDYRIGLKVYDDGSTHDYSVVKKHLLNNKWDYVRFAKNNGKKRAWRVSNEIYKDAKRRNSKYFMILPDDIRLCSNFFNKAIGMWSSIPHANKAAMVLAKDSGRNTEKGPGPCWTNTAPIRISDDVWETAWVDEMFISEKKYFSLLNYQVNKIPSKRFLNNNNISSGVGRQVSMRMRDKKHRLYCVDKSLVRFSECKSEMNPREREANPMVALSFIDDI